MGAIAETAAILNRPRCCCSRPKQKAMAVCGNCYRLLTTDLRRGLYRHANDGFLEAYNEAVEHLKNTDAFRVANAEFVDGVLRCKS